MVGARTRRLRARDGGQPQGGDPALRELAREFRAALLSPPRGGGRDLERRPEWRCAPCGASNWLDRSCCRACGKNKGSKKIVSKTEAAKPATEKDAVDKSAAEESARSHPLAPEVRAAEAEMKAAALESSAATLRAAGFADKAEGLDAEAKELRKQAATLPPPGRRLTGQRQRRGSAG